MVPLPLFNPHQFPCYLVGFPQDLKGGLPPQLRLYPCTCLAVGAADGFGEEAVAAAGLNSAAWGRPGAAVSEAGTTTAAALTADPGSPNIKLK